jgi:DNA-directed RNA polymerase subunit RPC12/RpoP
MKSEMLVGGTLLLILGILLIGTLFCSILGIILLFLGLIVLLGGLAASAQPPPVYQQPPPQYYYQQPTQVIKETEIREIVKIRCQYCGNLYEERENRCPKCGGK